MFKWFLVLCCQYCVLPMKTPEHQVFSLVGNFKALGGLKGLQIVDAFLLEVQKPQLV